MLSAPQTVWVRFLFLASHPTDGPLRISFRHDTYTCGLSWSVDRSDGHCEKELFTAAALVSLCDVDSAFDTVAPAGASDLLVRSSLLHT